MGSFYTVVITSMGITYRWAWIMDSLNLHLSWEADQLLSGKYLHKFASFSSLSRKNTQQLYDYGTIFFSLPSDINEHFPRFFSHDFNEFETTAEKQDVCLREIFPFFFHILNYRWIKRIATFTTSTAPTKSMGVTCFYCCNTRMCVCVRN